MTSFSGTYEKNQTCVQRGCPASLTTTGRVGGQGSLVTVRLGTHVLSLSGAVYIIPGTICVHGNTVLSSSTSSTIVGLAWLPVGVAPGSPISPGPGVLYGSIWASNPCLLHCSTEVRYQGVDIHCINWGQLCSIITSTAGSWSIPT